MCTWPLEVNQRILCVRFKPPDEDATLVANCDSIYGTGYDRLVNLPYVFISNKVDCFVNSILCRATMLVNFRTGVPAQTVSLDMWYRNGGDINTRLVSI